MAKKKKATLYADIDEDLKERLQRLAEKRARKLAAEVNIMVRQYLEREEPKEGLSAEDAEN